MQIARLTSTAPPVQLIGDVRQVQGSLEHAIERLHGRDRKLGGDIEPGFARRILIDLGLAKPIWDDRLAAAGTTRRGADRLDMGIERYGDRVSPDARQLAGNLVDDMHVAARHIEASPRHDLPRNQPALENALDGLRTLERMLAEG